VLEMKRGVVTAGALWALVAGAGGFAVPADADEVKTQVSALTLVNSVLTTTAHDRQTAYDEAVKAAGGPAPRTALGGEAQPDGSVRYGKVTVTVRNPCPPGTDHYEPPPLPGRRGR
jgi:hypothetical protein